MGWNLTLDTQPRQEEVIHRGEKGKITAAARWYADFDASPMFSEPSLNNVAKFLVDGSETFEEIQFSIKKASAMVWIAGWGITPFLALRRDGQKWETLFDILRDAVKRRVDVRVLLWDSRTLAMDLKDDVVEERLQSIGARVLRHRPGAANAHHQKFIVIDEYIVFLGSIDLLQGRWDTGKHVIMPLSGPHKTAPVDPLESAIAWGNAMVMGNPYDAYNPCRADATDQKQFMNVPRLPFHEVSVKITGSAACYVARNFAQRWKHHNKDHQALHDAFPLDKLFDDFDEAIDKYRKMSNERGSATDVEPPVPEHSNIPIMWEEVSEGEAVKAPPADPDGCAVQIVRSISKSGGAEATEQTIYNAYLNAIQSATHYIYIENQYFISKSGDEDQDVRNEIAIKILERVTRAVKAHPKEPFHVFIVLPVHPEGVLHGMYEPELVKDLYDIYEEVEELKERAEAFIKLHAPELVEAWNAAKNFIEYLRNSAKALVQKVKRAIVNAIKKVLPDWLIDAYHSVCDRIQAWWEGSYSIARKYVEQFGSYLDELRNLVDMTLSATHAMLVFQQRTLRFLVEGIKTVAGDDWVNYLSLFALRTHKLPAKQGDRYMTEQIYVHSKLMIVDDNVVIVGSPNINDRSMCGDRDTEMAAVIVGQATEKAPINKKPRFVRTLARDLRIKLWNEHFNESFPDPLMHGEEPTYVALQNIAKRNTEVYRAVFKNMFGTEKKLDTGVNVNKDFQVDAGSVGRLAEIKGHAVEFSAYWLEHEDLTVPEKRRKEWFTWIDPFGVPSIG